MALNRDEPYIVLNGDSGVAHYAIHGLTAEACNVDDIADREEYAIAMWPTLESNGARKCERCWPRMGSAAATEIA